MLAEKSGISRQAFLACLNDSVMGSTFTRYKTPAYVNLDFEATFTATLLRKDFDLGLAAAREREVPCRSRAGPPDGAEPGRARAGGVRLRGAAGARGARPPG